LDQDRFAAAGCAGNQRVRRVDLTWRQVKRFAIGFANTEYQRFV
jgi:hypothetical protein